MPLVPVRAAVVIQYSASKADDGVTLYESTPIVEYLEERYPERPLLPRDPAARARVRIEEFEAFLYFSDAFREVGQRVAALQASIEEGAQSFTVEPQSAVKPSSGEASFS